MINQNIAIFGATGHIGKNLCYYFSQNKKNNLTLFGRNEKKIKKTMMKIILDERYNYNEYSEFEKNKYDVIINCIGIGDPNKISNKNNILEITEIYDNKIIDYLKNKKSTKYINFSSGAIFGQEFKSPVLESTPVFFDINQLKRGNFYAISKFYSEVKHRDLNYLNIVDLRIFGFFSRFIDLKTKYLMSHITNSIKNNQKFVTDKDNIYRDYIHPQDLFKIIKKCINEKKINTAFNVSSKKPICKFNLLKILSKQYGLKYIIQNKKQTSPTGIKTKYYSKIKNITDLEISPEYSSLQTILMELKQIVI